MSGKGLPKGTAGGQRLRFAADGSLLDNGDHLHRDDFTVLEPQGYLGTAGQRFGLVRLRRPGPQPAVQFIDPIAEDDEFVSALYCLGRVPVVAHHAAVVLDLDLEAITPLAQPIQLGGEVLPRRIRR